MQSGMEKLNSGQMVKEIASSFQSGATPMDFITKNLRQPGAGETGNVNAQTAANVAVAAGVVDGANIPQPVMHKPTEAPADSNVTPSDLRTKEGKSIIDEAMSNYLNNTVKPQEEKKEEPVSQDAAPSDSGELKDSESFEGKKKSFFKDLRDKVKGLETVVQEKETVLTDVQAKNSKYETGEEIPEILKPKLERLQELEKYEKLYALDSSPEFRELYLAPLEQAKEELNKFAEDYGIPKNVMEQISEMTNRRELNRALSDYCEDALGADEARRLIDSLNQKKAVVKEARNSAESTLNSLLSKNNEMYQMQEQERISHVKGVASSAWKEGIGELLSTGNYPELTIKDGDKDHNAISGPIIERAAGEFGKVMNILAAAGIKSIPKEAAKIIAKRFATSEAAPIIAASRGHFYQELQKLIGDGHNAAKYDRPPMGGLTNGSSSPAASSGPIDAKTGANMLLRQVGAI